MGIFNCKRWWPFRCMHPILEVFQPNLYVSLQLIPKKRLGGVKMCKQMFRCSNDRRTGGSVLHSFFCAKAEIVCCFQNIIRSFYGFSLAVAEPFAQRASWVVASIISTFGPSSFSFFLHIPCKMAQSVTARSKSRTFTWPYVSIRSRMKRFAN